MQTRRRRCPPAAAARPERARAPSRAAASRRRGALFFALLPISRAGCTPRQPECSGSVTLGVPARLLIRTYAAAAAASEQLDPYPPAAAPFFSSPPRPASSSSSSSPAPPPPSSSSRARLLLANAELTSGSLFFRLILASRSFAYNTLLIYRPLPNPTLPPPAIMMHSWFCWLTIGERFFIRRRKADIWIFFVINSILSFNFQLARSLERLSPARVSPNQR